MAKEITLEELAKSAKPISRPVTTDTVSTMNTGFKNARPVSIETLGKNLAAKHPEANKQPESVDAPLVANAFAALDDTINKKIEGIAEERAAKQEEAFANGEVDENGIPFDKTVEDEPVEVEEPVVEDTSDIDEDIESVTDEDESESADDASLDDMLADLGTIDEPTEDDLTVEDEEETPEEIRNRFKASMDSIKVTNNVIDLSKFVINGSAVSATKVLNNIAPLTRKRADWVLLETGRSITFEECSGPELDNLNKTLRNSNGLNSTISALRFAYDHTIDANKPDFETWCKSIRAEDYESIYFGIYKACYADSNLLAYNDGGEGGCKKTSLIKTDINDMIKFADDESKTKFDRLMKRDSTTEQTKMKPVMMQISDDLAISYSMPTLYSTFIQYSALTSDIVEKYSDYLNTMAYIEDFFIIDAAKGQLVRIDTDNNKKNSKNISRKIMNKLSLYIKLLKTLSADQYNIMTAKLNNLVSVPKITYINPECECPECGHKMPEEPIQSTMTLLFTRAQLAQVKSL